MFSGHEIIIISRFPQHIYQINFLHHEHSTPLVDSYSLLTYKTSINFIPVSTHEMKLLMYDTYVKLVYLIIMTLQFVLSYYFY